MSNLCSGIEYFSARYENRPGQGEAKNLPNSTSAIPRGRLSKPEGCVVFLSWGSGKKGMTTKRE